MTACSADSTSASTDARASVNPTEPILQAFASALDLPLDTLPLLARHDPFTGPSGFPCRVLVRLEPPALRPEVLLPLTLEDLEPAELRRLLRLQPPLLAMLGLYLGPCPEGPLSVSPVHWMEDGLEAASLLDLANAVARLTVAELRLDIGDHHAHTR